MTRTWNYGDPYAYMDRVAGGMPPVIICLAANGGIQGKEYNDALPETSEELAESVGEAYDAGASMVHIHARQPRDAVEGGDDDGGVARGEPPAARALPRDHHQQYDGRRPVDGR